VCQDFLPVAKVEVQIDVPERKIAYTSSPDVIHDTESPVLGLSLADPQVLRIMKSPLRTGIRYLSSSCRRPFSLAPPNFLSHRYPSSTYSLTRSDPFSTTFTRRASTDVRPPPSSSSENPHRAYYQTHGRAFLKCFALAFLTYQLVYWVWLFIESEDTKDRKQREIKGLEMEVKMLQGGRGSHSPRAEEERGKKSD
jgi:hypothetical protein